MRARLLVLVVGIPSMVACGGGTFEARDDSGSGGGAEYTGGQGGGAPTGGTPGHGGSATGGAEGCSSPQDCPVTDSCQMCWDQSCVSSVADCVDGQCVVIPGVCPRNPCEGVACGGGCELPCEPNTACQTGFCDGAGACVASMPRCACGPDVPCEQPVGGTCVVCANGVTVCHTAVCYNGQCQLVRPRCPCDPMQAAGSGNCALVLGAVWNGTACVTVSGCECTGPDCPSLFPDVPTCKEKQLAQCPATTTG